MNIRQYAVVAAFVIASLRIGSVAAQDVPHITSAEWASWPPYCQARHVTIPPGDTSKYVLTFPRSKIKAARQLLGEPTFVRVHHYCRGLIWFDRATVETDPALKKRYLQWAQNEVIFTYKGLPTDSPLIGPTFIMLGRICNERGDTKCAVANLQKAITLRPRDPSGYSALAIQYQKQKKLERAKETLLQGDRATGGKSPEIDYNLGLIYLELGDVDAAAKRAHIAYNLGYPLPGLKRKLQRLGKWQETDDSAPKAR